MPKRVSFVLGLRADAVVSAVEGSRRERRHLLCFSETTSCSSSPISISFQPRRNSSPLHILAFSLRRPSHRGNKQTDVLFSTTCRAPPTHRGRSSRRPTFMPKVCGFSTWQADIDRQRFPAYDDWEGWRLITGNCLIVWRGIVFVRFHPSEWMKPKRRDFIKCLTTVDLPLQTLWLGFFSFAICQQGQCVCPGVVHCLSNEAVPLPKLEQKVMKAPSVLRLKSSFVGGPLCWRRFCWLWCWSKIRSPSTLTLS